MSTKVFNFQLQRYDDLSCSAHGLFHELKVGAPPLFLAHTIEDGGKLLPGDYEIKAVINVSEITTRYRQNPNFREFFRNHLVIHDATGQVAQIRAGDAAHGSMEIIISIRSVDCYTSFYKYLYPELEKDSRAFLKIRDENDLILP